ncbi:hypothetical protein BD626DRAFT_399398 [Schizophyllum amplum]|uniref:Uncharacterized protein n=1 Tax=Schizophyllum amplum TaxID=97359 RepID=A0A550CK19_9AGAR|nr:hypothetical protein BD626DRAFT_399398 [Auriculariopsis ampla]
MVFYLLHSSPFRIPEPRVFFFRPHGKWVAIGGTYRELRDAPRWDRLTAACLLKAGPGPRWICAPWIWRPYGLSTVEGPDDPLTSIIARMDLQRLVYHDGTSRLPFDFVTEITRRARDFEEIAISLRDSAPPLFFLRDGAKVAFAPMDPSSLSLDGRPGQVLNRLEEFQTAAMDRVAFTAWFTLNFKGWERYLNDRQTELIRCCSFADRPKKGCLVNLIVDAPLVNFETWIDHRVPVYYPWTEAMHYIDRMARADPANVRAYWEMRQKAASEDDLAVEALRWFKEHDPRVFSHDNFFQSRDMRSVLINTPAQLRVPYLKYYVQACQNYRPCLSRDVDMTNRLLEGYEALRVSSDDGCIFIARWAARAPACLTQYDEEYTAELGLWDDDRDDRFLGRAYDKETGWVTNDFLAMRELHKVAFAPYPGEIYCLDGKRLHDRFIGARWLRSYEEGIVNEAIQDGQERPADLRQHFEWEGARESELLDRIEKDARALRGIEDARPLTPPAKIPLAERLSDEFDGEGSSSDSNAPDSGDDDDGGRRRNRAYYTARARASVGSSALSSGPAGRRGAVGSSGRRSASPVPRVALAEPRRVAPRPVEPDEEGWEAAEDALGDQLELLGSMLVEPMPRLRGVPAPGRRPRILWEPEFLDVGLIRVVNVRDRLRLFLYTLLHRYILTAEEFLDYLVERGIKFVLLVPRDPIPQSDPDDPTQGPSSKTCACIVASDHYEAFNAWEGTLQGPVWAKTHVGAFVREGSVVNFVARHYAIGMVINQVGAGVCPETRVHAGSATRLPGLGETHFVFDEMSAEERDAVVGRVFNPLRPQNTYYLLPPPALFESKEWDVGTGEWTDLEEEYLEEILNVWKSGRGEMRTKREWERHARAYLHGVKARPSFVARDPRFPSNADCAQWCKRLEDAYGFSLEVRTVQSLTEVPSPVRIKKFV